MISESLDISRRSFLASAAAAAAVTATRSRFSFAAESDKTIGYALVGIGSLSMKQLLPAFANCKIARPVALVSGHPEKANEQAKMYGIDPKNIYNYDNFDSIKNNPEIDVVYIVLPNSMHCEYTVRAAQAGKHVLCEKPMANTPEECQQMIDACKAANCKLSIGYRLHHEPCTQNAVRLAQSATDVGHVTQITGESGFVMGDPAQWRCNRKLAGGGSLMDIGIYALNHVRNLVGQEPVEVCSAQIYSTPNDPRFKEVEELITYNLKFPSGLLASLVSSYGIRINRFRVNGTAGQLEGEPFLSYSGNRLYKVRDNKREQEIPYEPVNHFAA